MKRTLVLDGQVFQSPAWHRGMGKYSMELIVALNSLNTQKKYWERIEVVLSKKLEIKDDVLRNIKNRAPEVDVIKLNLAPNQYDNKFVSNKNRKVVDGYFKKKLLDEHIQSIDFIVLSLMQSEVAPAFSSLTNVTNYLLFYDLIPLMFRKTYLPNIVNQTGYLSKLAELLKADYYLTISKTVANDLSFTMGIDTDRIVSIDGAPINHGSNVKNINVPKPFILMPTGDDSRKNNRRGIEGFQLFNAKNNNKYNLIITSTFQDFEIEELKKLSNHILFTGNISGEELEYLYQESSALLFPSEYEGLGLPILEALEKNKPIACSEISVFREISNSAFFYFDPRQVSQIAESLGRALTAKELPTMEYERIAKKFTWNRTAQLFAEVALHSKSRKPQLNNELAVFFPSPDKATSGVELQQLYSELQRNANSMLYMDSDGEKATAEKDYISHITNVTDISYPGKIKLPDNSLPVYYVEDSPSCAAILLTALANPGILILKDLGLKTLWDGAVKRSIIHESRLILEEELNRQYSNNGYLISLLTRQKTIVVHEKQAKKRIESLLSKVQDKFMHTKVLYLPPPATRFTYSDLKSDMSMIDYPEPRHAPIISETFGEFAKSIVKESTESRV